MSVEFGVRYLLPRTRELLEKDIQARREKVTSISRQGAGMWEGDQWHSSAYRTQQTTKEVAILFLQLIDQGLRIENLPKPTQIDRVQIGHMVKVRLLDDPEIAQAGIPYSVVHVLTKEDSQYLGPLFDGLREMIISQETPLGQALIGSERGRQSSYYEGQRLQILDSEDAIAVSSLFEVETET